jgi:hemerythrin-like domain-containing protein
MDPFKLLKQDHDKVKGLFREYEEAGDHAYRTKERIAGRVFEELAIHEQIEEEIFYPAVRDGASQGGVEIVLEGYEEHHVVDFLIGELKAIGVKDETHDAKFKVLTENVEHHIEEEEGEMFAEARRALGDAVDEVGERMMELKKSLTSSARKRSG